MTRPKRNCPAGEVRHVLNRAVAQSAIFEKPADYDVFLRVLNETSQLAPLPIFAMAVMLNDGHLVVRTTTDEQVSDSFRRLTVMRTMRDHSRAWVNKPQTEAEVKALGACSQRLLPFGDDPWIKSSTLRLCLASDTCPRGRPRKES